MLEVYASRPADPSVRTVDDARQTACNWFGPREVAPFAGGVPRGDTFGALPSTSDSDPAGFYGAPFAGWAADTFRFDLYQMHTPNGVDDFALLLRMWISVRGEQEVNLGGGWIVPMETLRSLHRFAGLTVKQGLWWRPEP